MQCPISAIEVKVYTVPTDSEESDGTFTWNNTTLILVRIAAANHQGIGYSYANATAANLIHDTLKNELIGMDAMNVGKCWQHLNHQIRNIGRPGIAAHAIAAIDIALWDLKAKILNLPLCILIGKVKDEIAVYGSGGFTSYSNSQLEKQFTEWLDQGISMYKMKIGGQPAKKDINRVAFARKIIGDNNELFVDANGAYSVIEALQQASRFGQYNVTWFEEPVSSDDLKGLYQIRQKCQPELAITAGEYGYDQFYFQKMLTADAVDVLQLDATRCMGITGLIKSYHLAESFHVPVSAHTAPAIHLHPLLTMEKAIHIEYFYDHSRIEDLFFEGNAKVKNGKLLPDSSRPGLGISLKEKDAESYLVS